MINGLYAVTAATDGEIAARVEQVLDGGARVVQYRDKSSDSDSRMAAALALKALCKRYGVPFLVNDDVELAYAAGADGVHLGAEDVALQEARQKLGPAAVIGISCYNRLELALLAEERGADYVAFGSFFPSSTKPDAVRASPALLHRARRSLHIPIVAIGGISPNNGGSLIQAGADALAVVDGLFGQPDIRAAARSYAQLFRRHRLAVRQPWPQKAVLTTRNPQRK